MYGEAAFCTTNISTDAVVTAQQLVLTYNPNESDPRQQEALQHELAARHRLGPLTSCAVRHLCEN